jgi:hypothetical protein
MRLQCRQDEVPERIANLIPFHASAMVGAFTSDGVYEVRSYETTILSVHPIRNARLNIRDYSPTTARHRNLCYHGCVIGHFAVVEYVGETATILAPGAAQKVEVRTLERVHERPRRNPADGPRVCGMIYR